MYISVIFIYRDSSINYLHREYLRTLCTTSFTVRLILALYSYYLWSQYFYNGIICFRFK